jgi:hypothetical protein
LGRNIGEIILFWNPGDFPFLDCGNESEIRNEKMRYWGDLFALLYPIPHSVMGTGEEKNN